MGRGGVGLKSCPIPTPPPLWGGENLCGAKWVKWGGEKLPSLDGEDASKLWKVNCNYELTSMRLNFLLFLLYSNLHLFLLNY